MDWISQVGKGSTEEDVTIVHTWSNETISRWHCCWSRGKLRTDLIWCSWICPDSLVKEDAEVHHVNSFIQQIDKTHRWGVIRAMYNTTIVGFNHLIAKLFFRNSHLAPNNLFKLCHLAPNYFFCFSLLIFDCLLFCQMTTVWFHFMKKY